MKKKLIYVSMVSVVLLGCAHQPSIGERMTQHSLEAKIIANDWDKGEKLFIQGGTLEKKGKKLTSDGQSNINKGNKLISKGEKQINHGNELISESKKLMADGITLQKRSEEEFREKYPEKLD